MRGNLVYGALTGVLVAALLSPYVQPLGSILLWGITAVQLGLVALVLWRRTGLPFATASMAVGAATGLVLCLRAVGGHRFPEDGLPWITVPLVGILLALLGFLLESRIHRAAWNVWRRRAREATTLDFITLRHIPDLRHRDGDE